ncbi:hypothetical protein GOV03_04155 [Candidatus Woesearchaeota archaeon]|nr:hypothetical protein [Candidatus Woesearchaeota archaeon]
MGKIIYVLLVLLLVNSVWGATLHGEIYDLDLDKVTDVLVEINTVPKQQSLSKTGAYSFEVPAGDYILKARKGFLVAEEEIKVVGEGEFIYDLFLFPSFEEEDDFLTELGVIEIEEEKKGFAKYPMGSYLIALGILLIAMGRIVLARKKYGKSRKRKNKEEKVEEELTDGEDYLEKALELIRKEGRISQKELRKEMMYLSEAKISLILTELEHKGKIEKVKKGRGNVVILKE